MDFATGTLPNINTLFGWLNPPMQLSHAPPSSGSFRRGRSLHTLCSRRQGRSTPHPRNGTVRLDRSAFGLSLSWRRSRKRHGPTETVTTPENQRQHGRAWVGSPASLSLLRSYYAVTINVPNYQVGDVPTYQIQNNSPLIYVGPAFTSCYLANCCLCEAVFIS